MPRDIDLKIETSLAFAAPRMPVLAAPTEEGNLTPAFQGNANGCRIRQTIEPGATPLDTKRVTTALICKP
jgi:hypothetical protein